MSLDENDLEPFMEYANDADNSDDDLDDGMDNGLEE
jgi:hypothetical protein